MKQKFWIVLMAFFLVCGVVFAFVAAPAAYAIGENTGIPHEFDVRKWLQLGGGAGETVEGQQGFKYTDAKKCPPETSPVACFIVDVIDFLVLILGPLSLLVFIAGALLSIASEGKEDRLQQGKNAMLYSVVGLIVAIMAYAIATLVQSIFY